MKRIALFFFAMTSVGCEGPRLFSDLAKGLVPEPEGGYDAGGRLLHEGEFHALALEVVPPSYDFALAIDDDSGLLIHAIGSGKSCWVGGVVDHQPAVFRTFELDDPRIPVMRRVGGSERLEFADLDCRLGETSIPAGRVVDWLPLPDDGGVIVEGEGQRVLAVSPWRERALLLGTRVLGDEHPFRYSLLVEDGRLVLYDVLARPVVRVGTDVVDAGLLADAGQLFLLDDAGKLSMLPLDGASQASVIAGDVCHLIDAGPTGTVLGFHSPCAAQRLVLHRPGTASTGETFELAADAAAPRLVARSLEFETAIEGEALSAVFFRDFEDGVGTLWAQTAGEPPYPLVEHALDHWMLAAFDRERETQRIVALALTVDRETEDVALRAADDTREVLLASRLRLLYEQPSSLLLVAEGSGDSADLVLLEAEAAEGVTVRDPELLLSAALAGLPVERSVVLEGVEDEAGVRLLDGGKELSLFRTDAAHERALYLLRQSPIDGTFAEPVRIARGVGRQYSFSMNVPDTVLALFDAKGPGHTLRQLWLEDGLESTIADRVSSYYESPVNGRNALLYATIGPTAGLYYSGLR